MWKQLEMVEVRKEKEAKHLLKEREVLAKEAEVAAKKLMVEGEWSMMH